MRGRALPLSLPRRLVGDLMYFSMGVPRVTVQRRMHLARLVQARNALASRPSWMAIFIKGYSLLAQEFPELRRTYMRLPWPHLYEYPDSSVGVAHERDFRGEKAVLHSVIRSPAQLSLNRLSAIIVEARSAPVMEVKSFRRALNFARLPLLLRRLLLAIMISFGRQRANYLGTFHFSVYSGLGAESFNPLSPVTTLLNYGPIDEEGGVNVRVLYDHRVMDGAMVARALVRFEEILGTTLVEELAAMARRQAAVTSAGPTLAAGADS